MAEALLEVRRVTKRFGGVTALAGVSLVLPPGEVRGLIGPNGAGKTTLFNVITGHLPCDDGAVLFRGARIDGDAPHRIVRKGLSRTFQVPAAFRSLSVRENVVVALQAGRRAERRLFDRAGAADGEGARQLLERVGLGRAMDRRCGSLSLSDVKRVELALALATTPDLLLLDEPAAGMAAAERRELLALIADIVQERKLTVLFIEHDMDVVFKLATRLTVMHQGRILAEGEPQAVRHEAEVRRVYLGEEA
jgi:ABC-type branched-subunit amino acid transport system ATPase component